MRILDAPANVKLPSVAILGTRGIPSEYGGFETFGEKLASHLLAKNFNVSAYGVSRYRQNGKPSIPGLTQHWLPTPKHRALEKPVAAWASVVHASLSEADVILMLGVSPALLALLPKAAGKRLIINLDGVEWKRRKWGPLAKAYLYLSEVHAKQVAHATIVDSKALLPYHQSHPGPEPYFIPYGADLIYRSEQDSETLKPLGLEPDRYLLQVCRLEPENNPDWVIREYLKSRVNLPLVIAGDSPYPTPYVQKLLNADNRVRFLGRVHGDIYKALLSNSSLYIHGHEIGGTNPSLLEAMGAGCPVVALDVAFNREALGPCGVLCGKRSGELASILNQYWDNDTWQQRQSALGRNRISEHYSWSPVLEAYEKLISGVMT